MTPGQAPLWKHGGRQRHARAVARQQGVKRGLNWHAARRQGMAPKGQTTQAHVLPRLHRPGALIMARWSEPILTESQRSLPRGSKSAAVAAPTCNEVDDEQTMMLAFIDQQRAAAGGESPEATDRTLVEFCHVLLCLNEFVYVD